MNGTASLVRGAGPGDHDCCQAPYVEILEVGGCVVYSALVLCRVVSPLGYCGALLIVLLIVKSNQLARSRLH